MKILFAMAFLLALVAFFPPSLAATEDSTCLLFTDNDLKSAIKPLLGYPSAWLKHEGKGLPSLWQGSDRIYRTAELRVVLWRYEFLEDGRMIGIHMFIPPERVDPETLLVNNDWFLMIYNDLQPVFENGVIVDYGNPHPCFDALLNWDEGFAVWLAGSRPYYERNK